MKANNLEILRVATCDGCAERKPIVYEDSDTEAYLCAECYRPMQEDEARQAIVEAALVIDQASRNPNWEGWSRETGWDDAFDDLAAAVDAYKALEVTINE